MSGTLFIYHSSELLGWAEEKKGREGRSTKAGLEGDCPGVAGDEGLLVWLEDGEVDELECKWLWV